jgi:hypothetical protein
VTVVWQVDHIRKVYLNDQAQTGSGASRTCNIDTAPSLMVGFQDGSQQSYRLDVSVLSTSSLTWIWAALALLTVILHRNTFWKFFARPLHLPVIIGTIVAILFLFFGPLIRLGELVAVAQWSGATRSLTQLVTGMTLLVILVAICVAIGRDVLQMSSPTHPPSHFRLLWGWAIGLGLTMCVISGIIVAIDPLGMYFGSSYTSHQLLLRGIKTDGYNRLPQTPDIAIMGSSRAFTLSPDYIHEKIGYTAYNMSVEGGRIEDILIQARQMRALPEVMLIEVQTGLPRQPNDIAARAPLWWIPYMSFNTALLTVQKRLEGLLDINQLSEAIYLARYSALYDHQPKEWPEFAPDGFAVRPPISSAELQRAVSLDIGNIPAIRCDRVNETSQSDVNELIQMASAHHTALVFYLSPWHPQYDEAILKNDPQFQECRRVFIAYMNELTQSQSGVFFQDYSALESIGGTSDETGFYDSQHLTAANSELLIDHAAPTLRLAYQNAHQGS